MYGIFSVNKCNVLKIGETITTSIGKDIKVSSLRSVLRVFEMYKISSVNNCNEFATDEPMTKALIKT